MISTHLFLYSVTPEPLEVDTATKVLDFLIKMKPIVMLKKGILAVSNHPYFPGWREDQTLLESIDMSIQTIIHYFSASNWDLVYGHLLKIFKKAQNAKVEDPDILPGLEILGTLYLDSDNLIILTKEIHSIVPSIKKTIHTHTMEHFYQRSVAYWAYARPQELVYLSHNETPMTSLCMSLFDYIYSSADNSKRYYSSWSMLGLLICFLPRYFEEDDANSTPASSRSKLNIVRSSFKKNSNSKKHAFLFHILNIHQDALDPSVLFATFHILKAGSLFAITCPDSPIVAFSKKIYPVLLPHLLMPSVNQTFSIDLFQSSFVTSYAILNPEDLLRDILPLTNVNSNFPQLIPNILQGHINLQQIPLFKTQYNFMMKKIYHFVREASYSFSNELKNLEKNPALKADKDLLRLQDCYIRIVSHCYTIFSENPSYIVFQHNYNTVCQEDQLFLSVLDNLQSKHNVILTKAIAFAKSFLELENLASFGDDDLFVNPNNPILPSFQQFGFAAMVIAKNILAEKYLETPTIMYLELIKSLLEGRIILIQKYKLDQYCDRDPTKFESRKFRESISSTVETAMYVCLCSSSTEVCKIAYQILNSLVTEALAIEDVDRKNNSGWSVLPNLATLSEFSSSSHVLTGTIATQKRLFHFLQTVQVTTPPIIEAWKIINTRWHDLTTVILQQTSLDRSLIKLWKSYCGFLCSLLSPFLVRENEPVIEGQLSHSSQKFLLEIISILTLKKSAFLRETARDVLSNDTSAISYHFIFKTIQEEIVTRLGKSGGVLEEQDILLLEQSVMLLRTVVGKINNGDIYLSVDIASLALTIVKCLDSSTPDERNIRLRVHYCHLFELIASHQDNFNIKHDMAVRNDVALIFAGWLDKCISTKFSDDTDSIKSGNTGYKSVRRKEAEYERFQKDCVCAIVQSYTEILFDLRLLPGEGVHHKDYMNRKSQMFDTIFMLFLRILEKCRAEEIGSTTGSLGLGDRLNSLKKNTINCASKLLNSNMDVGLKFVLPLGFKEDEFIRVSFIKILNNTLNHNCLSPGGETDAKTYAELVDFLIDHIDVTLSLCDICPATEFDEFSNSLINIFDSKGKCLMLVKAAVTREMEKAETPLESLRRNCVATKILSIYAHLKGNSYLQVSLGPFLREIIANPDKYVFEANPDKIPPGQTIESNFRKFDSSTKKLVSALQSTYQDVPAVLREVCYTIASSAGAKFLNSKNSSVTAVSSFFILRFICPALVSPESEGLLKTAPSKEVRRTLLLLAKMIQNMANGSSSFVKLPTDKLHSANYTPDSDAVIQFLRNISTLAEENTDDNISVDSGTGSQVEQSNVEFIHKFLYHHWEDINHKMVMDQRLKGLGLGVKYIKRPTSDEDDDARTRQKFISLIRNLGRPTSLKPAPPASVIIDNTTNIQSSYRLLEFLRRNSHRDMGPIIDRRIISQGMDKDGKPIIIFTLRNYNKDEVDTELVLCRWFQVASKVWKDRFSIFFDVTSYTSENVIPNSIRTMFNAMVPEDMVKNCDGVYFCNVNTEYLPFLKALIKLHYSGIFLNPMRYRYDFVTSEDIANRFNISTLNLDPKTTQVINDVRIVFNNVYRYNPSRKDMRLVTFRLGNEYLQIKYQEPFNYVKSSPGFCNDIFHLKEIANIYKSNTNGHPDEFTIELSKPEGYKIILHCSKGYEIVRAILNAKTRLPKESINGTTSLSSVETSFAPLVNIAFSGLCSSSAEIQQESYNLMSSIQKRFDLNLGVVLRGGKGLRLPANVFGRVKKFSTAIALSKPEFTLDMLQNIFTAFKSTSVDRRQGILVYAIPWIKNLSKYVLADNSKESVAATYDIIRKLLDISIAGDRDYMFVLQSIWPVILEDEKLVPMVIDEIISLLMDNGIYSGPQMDDIISILTSMPSPTVCGLIVNRVTSMILDENDYIGIGLAKHPKFKEFVILISVLSAITFENPVVVERYFTELGLVIILFLHTGSYPFRKSLYNLMVNVLHSFLYSGWADEVGKEHLRVLWSDLTTNRGNMIFGISDEMKLIDYDYPSSSLMFQVETCTGFLCDVSTNLFATPEFADRMSRFVERCLTMSRRTFSVFQTRALLVLGCASRLDVQDSTVTAVLEILIECLNVEDNNGMREELLTCIIFSINKLSDGLRLESQYFPRLFWLAVAIIGTCNMKVFNFGLELLQTCLKSLDEYGSFKNTTIAKYLLSYRDDSRGAWTTFDNNTKIKFTEESFELAIASVLMRGLEKSTSRAATLSTFEVLLTVFARNDNINRERDMLDNMSFNSTVPNSLGYRASTASLKRWDSTHTFSKSEVTTLSSDSINIGSNRKQFPGYMPFLFILYLGSRSTSELKDFFWIAGLPEDHIEEDVPSHIKAFIVSDNTTSLMCMYFAVKILNLCDNEDNMELRVLACLRHLGLVNSDHFFKVYFIARPKIQRIIDNGPLIILLKPALEVARAALCHFDDLKRRAYYLGEMDKVLIKLGLNSALLSTNPSASSASLASTCEIYGNLSSVVQALIYYEDKEEEQDMRELPESSSSEFVF